MEKLNLLFTRDGLIYQVLRNKSVLSESSFFVSEEMPEQSISSKLSEILQTKFSSVSVLSALNHFTLMPEGSDILTVEFKTNLLAPAKGERFVFRGVVVKPGRTLTVCDGRAYAEQDGSETLIATMTGTLMALPRREGAAAQD
jgi:hypothetical protein